MANFAFCDGQAGVINLENVDMIVRSRNNESGKYEIEFYRSTRKTRKELPEFISVWTFKTEHERNRMFNDLIYNNGAKYEGRDHL